MGYSYFLPLGVVASSMSALNIDDYKTDGGASRGAQASGSAGDPVVVPSTRSRPVVVQLPDFITLWSGGAVTCEQLAHCVANHAAEDDRVAGLVLEVVYTFALRSACKSDAWVQALYAHPGKEAELKASILGTFDAELERSKDATAMNTLASQVYAAILKSTRAPPAALEPQLRRSRGMAFTSPSAPLTRTADDAARSPLHH